MAEITGGRLLSGSDDLPITSISTDTRSLKKGELFVALTGERFDGHRFLDQAFEKGACGAIVTKVSEDVQGCLILVEDTLKALQNLARWNRKVLSPGVIGVTGSIGKTTTKDMIAGVLSIKYSTLKTKENYNNEVGVPLTLLGLDETIEMAVVEMGMRGSGQIRELAHMAEPDVGVVTNVGPTHLELLGSIENIAMAKAELIESLGCEGVAILNYDDPFVRGMGARAKGHVITYGQDPAAQVRAWDIRVSGEEGTRFILGTGEDEMEMSVPLPGRHNIYNALAAASVGLAFGMSLEEISLGLMGFEATSGRMTILDLPNGLKVLDDTYNASPASVKAALDTLVDVAGSRRRVAVLGDMFELGAFAIQGHKIVGGATAEKGIHLLLGVGPLSKNTVVAAKDLGVQAFWFATKEDAWLCLKELACQGDAILVKGSRGMEMEYIVELLKSSEYI